MGQMDGVKMWVTAHIDNDDDDKNVSDGGHTQCIAHSWGVHEPFERANESHILIYADLFLNEN